MDKRGVREIQSYNHTVPAPSIGKYLWQGKETLDRLSNYVSIALVFVEKFYWHVSHGVSRSIPF